MTLLLVTAACSPITTNSEQSNCLETRVDEYGFEEVIDGGSCQPLSSPAQTQISENKGNAGLEPIPGAAATAERATSASDPVPVTQASVAGWANDDSLAKLASNVATRIGNLSRCSTQLEGAPLGTVDGLRQQIIDLELALASAERACGDDLSIELLGVTGALDALTQTIEPQFEPNATAASPAVALSNAFDQFYLRTGDRGDRVQSLLWHGGDHLGHTRALASLHNVDLVIIGSSVAHWSIHAESVSSALNVDVFNAGTAAAYPEVAVSLLPGFIAAAKPDVVLLAIEPEFEFRNPCNSVRVQTALRATQAIVDADRQTNGTAELAAAYPPTSALLRYYEQVHEPGSRGDRSLPEYDEATWLDRREQPRWQQLLDGISRSVETGGCDQRFAALSHFAQLGQANDFTTVVVLLPGNPELAAAGQHREAFAESRRRVAEVAGETSLKIIDLTDLELGSRQYWDLFHPFDDGRAAITQALIDQWPLD